MTFKETKLHTNKNENKVILLYPISAQLVLRKKTEAVDSKKTFTQFRLGKFVKLYNRILQL